jgi:hypothetical protein
MIFYLNVFFIIMFVPLSQTHAKEPDRDCADWFNKGKIEIGSKGCELKCATLMTDMGTFMCPDQCDLFCQKKESPNLLGKFIYYPGLTPAEKKLVTNRPIDALTVYRQMRIAEESSFRNFPNQDLNDESDAFRHFVWSGLLTKEIGSDKAKEFLDAHEANSLQPDNEFKMDTFNNNKGQSAAEALIKENNWNLKNLESKGLDELRSQQLQVLKPGLPIPKEPR